VYVAFCTAGDIITRLGGARKLQFGRSEVHNVRGIGTGGALLSFVTVAPAKEKQMRLAMEGCDDK